jgi:hypothetical protein
MFEGIKGQEVSVGGGESQQHGGCNGCTSFITANGSVPHRVWIINIRGFSFRLCDECKKEIGKRLGYEEV